MYDDDDDDEATAVMSNCSSDTDNTTSAQQPQHREIIEEYRQRPITAPTRHKALRALFKEGNVEWKKVATKKLVANVAWAISDSGATGHFVVEGAPVVNKKTATNPITITLPSGSTIRSTHTCNLDIPWLPHQVTEAHIVPGLAHSSLISTRKFCAAGCKVAFDEDECRVYYRGRLALVGGRCPITDL